MSKSKPKQTVKEVSPAKAPAKKTNPLAKYKRQAAPLIRIMFDESDATPDFMRDELYEILTEIESATQVFWNTREIAEVALPLMLQAADEMGIDWESHNSPFVAGALRSMYQNRDSEDAPPRDALRLDLEEDAAAIARILNSPHTPVEIKDKLGDALNNLMNEQNVNHETPDVLRAAYPLAVLSMEKEEGSAARDEQK